MDLVCPRCRESLQSVPALGGHAYDCPSCHGRAATLALLRRAGHRTVIQELWQKSSNNAHGTGLDCPSCHQKMACTHYSSTYGSVEFDLCETCQMLWLDGGEIDHLGEAPHSEISDSSFQQTSRKPKDQLNPTIPNILNNTTDHRQPTDTWSLMVGVLGLPQEINPTPTTSKPLATWSLIAIISIVTLSAHFHPPVADYLATTATSPWYERLIASTLGLFRFPDVISLLVNLYFLSVFGDNVEDAVGSWKFCSLFVGASILVTGTAYLFVESTHYSALGGSQGGIAAIIGFYATRWPKERLAVWPIAWLGPVGWVYMLTSFKQGRPRSGSISPGPLARPWQLPVWGWFAIWIACLLAGAVWLGGHRPTLVVYQLMGAVFGSIVSKSPLDRMISGPK